MAEEKKKVMSENSLKNLEKGKCAFAKDKELARMANIKSREKREENKQKRIARENGNIIAWDEFFGTKDQLIEFWNSLSPKDRKDIFIRLLPPDKQTSEIIGSFGIEKVFITESEKDATDNHIDNIINDES